MPMPVLFSPRWRGGWLLAGLLLVLVTGYWGFGKPFAYLGLYPLYLGEVALAIGLVLVASRGRYAILRHPSFWLWGLLLAIALVQGLLSVLELGRPALEAARDLAVLYYGLFAYLSFTLASTHGAAAFAWLQARGLPRMFGWVLAAYVLTFGSALMPAPLPRFPMTDVEVLFFKPTDAIMPFLIYLALSLRGTLPLPYLVLSLPPVLISAARSRSAMLCALLAALLTLRPSRRYLARVGMIVALVAVVAASGIKVDLGGYRELSAGQLMANTLSLLQDDDRSGSLDPTTTRNKAWRAEWWGRILERSMDEGWTGLGLGWGTNLAREFAISAPHSVRSELNAVRNPHNAFMGILARGGWLAAGTWALFYLALLVGLWRARKRLGDRTLEDMALALWIYLAASLINGSTDVFLESPQVAIPHWIAVGLAWGLLRLARTSGGSPAEAPEHRQPPELLAKALGDDAVPPRSGQEQ